MAAIFFFAVAVFFLADLVEGAVLAFATDLVPAAAGAAMGAGAGAAGAATG